MSETWSEPYYEARRKANDWWNAELRVKEVLAEEPGLTGVELLERIKQVRAEAEADCIRMERSGKAGVL